MDFVLYTAKLYWMQGWWLLAVWHSAQPYLIKKIFYSGKEKVDIFKQANCENSLVNRSLLWKYDVNQSRQKQVEYIQEQKETFKEQIQGKRQECALANADATSF